jgi:hypothetical protein
MRCARCAHVYFKVQVLVYVLLPLLHVAQARTGKCAIADSLLVRVVLQLCATSCAAAG